MLRSKWFWFVGVPLLVFIAASGMWYSGQVSLEEQIAALKAQGMPTTASEVNDFYVVPEGVADTTDLWVAAIDAVETTNLRKRARTLPFIGQGRLPVPPPGEAWAELKASRKLLGELKPELQAILRAAKAGGQVRFPVDFSTGVLRHTDMCREVARLLLLDAHVSTHDGDHSQVLRDLKAIFALSDALRGEPTQVSQMVRIIIHAIDCDAVERLLPHCDWNDAELESLQSAIHAARFKEEFARAMCGERAIGLTTIHSPPFTLGPLRQSNKREMLRVYELLIQGFLGSWPEIVEQQRELGAEVDRLRRDKLARFSMLGVSLLGPTFGFTSAGARANAMQKCTIAGIAAARFRLQHDRLPKSLAEIEPKFLPAALKPPQQLVDPFDGQPLRFKSEKDGLLIYSVGRNGQDDGGDISAGNKNDRRQPLDVGFLLKR